MGPPMPWREGVADLEASVAPPATSPGRKISRQARPKTLLSLRITFDHHLQANREILGEINVELTENLYKEISLRQGRSVFDLAAERGVGAGQIERLKVARNARYSDLIDAGVRALDGVPEALERFSGRIPMGIVTSSNPGHFERIHRQAGRLPFFDFVLASGDCVRHKPHPEPYLTGAAECPRIPKRRCQELDTRTGPTTTHPRVPRCMGDFSTPTSRSHEPGIHLEIAVRAGMLIPNRLPLRVLGKSFEVGVSLFLLSGYFGGCRRGGSLSRGNRRISRIFQVRPRRRPHALNGGP